MNNEISLNSKAHLFLCSSPFRYIYENGIFTNQGLYTENNLEDNLKKIWKENSKILYIVSEPSLKKFNILIIDSIKDVLKKTPLTLSCIDLYDSINQEKKLENYDVIFLGGGNVHIQNKFFEEIKLREKIKNFKGIIIGVSAGTMNCADIVYDPPELKEVVDPNKRFLKGLNLSKFMIVPHYYTIKDEKIDGKRIIEDIIFEDSMNKCFYILPDGSYIIQTLEESYLYGEGFIIKDKKMTKICENNEVKLLK
jgi:peptidase E